MLRRSRRSGCRSVIQVSDANTIAAMIFRMISVESGICSSCHTIGTSRTRIATPMAKRWRNAPGVASSSGVLRSRSERQKYTHSAIARALPSVANVNSVE